jgi:hypothetical protein
MAEPTTITLENMDRLKIDEIGRLYWDGKMVITEALLQLPTRIQIVGGIAAIVTILRHAAFPVSRGRFRGAADATIRGMTRGSR